MQVVGLRKLYLVDLISDALNGPLGLSVFVLLGCVARTLAGPSVIISVTFAAVVAIIAGEECGLTHLSIAYIMQIMTIAAVMIDS
jgi:hypothetical protein